MKIIQDSESDREITDEGHDPEEDDEISENRQENENNVRRESGCSKLLKTGKLGRPKKIYQHCDLNATIATLQT